MPTPSSVCWCISSQTTRGMDNGQDSVAKAECCSDQDLSVNEREHASLDGHCEDEVGSPTTRSKTSDMSDSDCSSMGSMSDDYCYHDDLDFDEDTNSMNPVLLDDIENVKQIFGDGTIHERLFSSIDAADIELNMGVSFLDQDLANAWRVNRCEPIVVRLSLSLSQYLDAGVPTITVFQPSSTDKFGLGTQLKKILEKFVSEHWKVLSNDSVKAQRTPLPEQSSGNASLADGTTVEDADIAKMVDMGFSATTAKNALVITRGNLTDALGFLLKDGANSPSNPEQKINKVKKKGLSPLKKKKEFLSKKILQKAQPKGLEIVLDEDAENTLLLLSNLSLPGVNAKSSPSLQYGFLVQVMQYMRQRIPTLNEYCVVCDEPHVFQNGAMLKPSVCSRELCVFAYQTLGVMANATDDIATGAEVVDLLIAMAQAACVSPRKTVVFNPYPTVVNPSCPTELALHPKDKDFQKVEKCLNNFIPVPQMAAMETKNIKKELDVKDSLAYPLLQWLISSNRSHIVKLDKTKQLTFMKTPYQFLLLSSPPAKEAAFRKARQKNGSTYAFHGSSIENWHSIMRQGLINASGTDKMLHGSVYGNGIYLSPQLSVASQYSNMGSSVHKIKQKPKAKSSTVQSKTVSEQPARFLQSDRLTCIALCEVITSSELKKHSHIWVCPNSDHVCTRFFFVYEDGRVGESTVDTRTCAVQREIKQATGYQVLDGL